MPTMMGTTSPWESSTISSLASALTKTSLVMARGAVGASVGEVVVGAKVG